MTHLIIVFLYIFVRIEYIEDICPYATFQLNKQTYSESSYSGNVYSGPYHSVRGSFVYHDAKPDGYNVTYQIIYIYILMLLVNIRIPLIMLIAIEFICFSIQTKEPEYTKVRRKGGRLRDPHSESQGNATRSKYFFT